MSKYATHKRLPKASLFEVRPSYVKQWFFRGHTVRIANAREFYWLGFWVSVRRPWLKHSAKALYPELFK